MEENKSFKPFVPPEVKMPEFTFKSIFWGSVMGILFGCSTVYLALKAGLTVTASIPIAVIAIMNSSVNPKIDANSIAIDKIVASRGLRSPTVRRVPTATGPC